MRGTFDSLSKAPSAFREYPVSPTLLNGGRGCQRAVRSFTALQGRLGPLVKQALAAAMTSRRCRPSRPTHTFVTTSPIFSPEGLGSPAIK